MRIAFDLDDTLIPCSHPFAVEEPTWLARCLAVEPLRRGHHRVRPARPRLYAARQRHRAQAGP